MNTTLRRLERIERGLGTRVPAPTGTPVGLTLEEATLLASARARAESTPSGDVEYSAEEIALLKDLETRRNAKIGATERLDGGAA